MQGMAWKGEGGGGVKTVEGEGGRRVRMVAEGRGWSRGEDVRVHGVVIEPEYPKYRLVLRAHQNTLEVELQTQTRESTQVLCET